MFTRATIVLLLVLNLGVAAWWLLHAEPAPATSTQPATAPRLQLVAEASADRIAVAAEASPRAAQSVASVAPPVRATPAPVAAPSTANVPVQAATGGSQCTGSSDDSVGWRVYVARLPSPDAAQAMAARIKAAGFNDLLVMRDGEDANTIALGRYSTRDAAQRHNAALQAAGFPARCVRIPASSPA